MGPAAALRAERQLTEQQPAKAAPPTLQQKFPKLGKDQEEDQEPQALGYQLIEPKLEKSKILARHAFAR